MRSKVANGGKKPFTVSHFLFAQRDRKCLGCASPMVSIGCDSVIIVASPCIGPRFLLHERLLLQDCRLFVVLRSHNLTEA